MRATSLIVVLLAALVSPIASAQGCFDVPHEYCQIGCEDLGAWTVEPAESLAHAQGRVAAFTGLSAVSAFAVQLPRSLPVAAVIRRETPADPATPIDRSLPGIRFEVYDGEHAALVAAAEAEVLGGWTYQGNDGQSVIRIWWEACPEAAPRKRPARP